MENYVQINTPKESTFHDRVGRVLGKKDNMTFPESYWVTFDFDTPPSEQNTELWADEKNPIWPFAEHELIQLDDENAHA